MKSPIKTHGGKSYLAKKIVDLFPLKCVNPNDPESDDPGYLHYVEPYCGGLSVLFENDPHGISEVANDLNGELTNWWDVLKDKKLYKEFKRRIEATPFSQLDFASAMTMLAVPPKDKWLRAWGFFVRCRQSLAARMDTFAAITRTRTRRGLNEQVSAWLGAIEGLDKVHERLKRVLILNEPAIDVIASEDGKRTLYYIDCPYLHSTRATKTEYGEYEMDRKDHIELLTALEGIKGRFVLSGYDSSLYQEFEKRNNWKRCEFKIANHASGAKIKRVMTEIAWFNY